MKKTLVMGLGLMVGGAVLVLALAQQPSPSAVVAHQAPNKAVTTDEVLPLNADIATERKILQIKTQEREQAVKRSDEQIRLLVEAQNSAKALAIQKANADQPVTDLVVQARPDAIALTNDRPSTVSSQVATQLTPVDNQPNTQKQQNTQRKNEQEVLERQKQKEQRDKEQKEKEQKSPKSHTVQAGDTLIRLSRRYDVPVSVLAEANGMGREDALPRGKTLKIPTQKEAERLKQTAAQRERSEQQQKAADERLKAARQAAKRKGVNEHYAVQVALSSSQESAERLVKQYQQAGYKAHTKQDARGIRVVIPERSREAALALKDKINHDPNVDSRGAWVLQVKP